MTIKKLLVANRGEIALRIMRTCRQMGIATVAVYSDADRDTPHVRCADEALRIGPAQAAKSYLCLPAIMEAAKRSAADALHPGYGFLSENPALPEACAAAGIAFVGPPAEAMRLLGDKVAARQVAEQHAVPVLPGIVSDARDDAALLRQSEAVGFPLMVKAAAGGGGRGMRLVQSGDALPEALTGARAEAEAAFGDGRLLLERAVVGGRHIEVQVLADGHGNAVHLGERDCSTQRRHQKVIEESPAPGIGSELRERLYRSALELTRAVGYENAGTVEFLVGRDDALYFLEMNARLQVEHGVTELVTGLDIVEMQLRIAAGESLPMRQSDIRPTGHAIECRVYAESPAKGFLPSSGRLTTFQPPEGEGIRNDVGVETNAIVSTAYDSLLAKLLVRGESREEALERCRRALAAYAVEGVDTNLGLLQAVMKEPAFVDGPADLRTLERMAPASFVSRPPSEVLLAAAADAVMANPGPATDPWDALGPWRVGGRWPFEFLYQGSRCAVLLEAPVGGGAWRAVIEHEDIEFSAEAVGPGEVVIRKSGAETRWSVRREGKQVRLAAGQRRYVFALPPGLSASAASSATGQAAETLRAPLPGVVVRVLVEEGELVAPRQPVIVLEAMKMEHTLEAPLGGIVKRIARLVGSKVSQGDVLVEFETPKEAAS